MRIDALVIGGGPAGALTACLLARRGWRTVLVEQSAFPRHKVCGEFLAPAALALLDELQLADVAAAAGPAVQRFALYAGGRRVVADLPDGHPWPARAVSRALFDARLLDHARAAGVDVWQPATVTSVTAQGTHSVCVIRTANVEQAVTARIVVAAHGSWTTGPLATQTGRSPPRAGDLFGFKAHFAGVPLAHDLLPLLVMPGGYAGAVRTSDGLVNLSCCVRRDALVALRVRHRGLRAGDAMLAALCAEHDGTRALFEGATRSGDWQACGPLRPGVRPRVVGSLYAVGNAAGESHPLVGEGIAMALQSAALLVEHLERRDAAAAYARAWRAAFVPRIVFSAAVAQLALRPTAASWFAHGASAMPTLLTRLARWSGKAPCARRATGA